MYYVQFQALKRVPVQSSVIRILPNMPLAIGAGSCIYSVDNNVTMDQCTVLENLLKGCGVVEKVPEKLMDPLGALTGCGPAFVSMF